MNYIYIIAALVSGLVVGFIVLAILWMSKRVSKNVTLRAMELISEYDKVLKSRNEVIEEKNREILEIEKKIEQLEKQKEEASKPQVVTETVSPAAFLHATERIATTEYRENNIAEIYQEIKRGFRKNPLETIRNIVDSDPSLMEGVDNSAKDLLDSLTFDAVYDLSTLPRENQYDLLFGMVDRSGRALMKEYVDINGSFDSISFYKWLKKKVGEGEEKIKLFVSPYDEKREYPSYVEVHEDLSIIEGFRLEVRGKILDYSIKEKDIS